MNEITEIDMNKYLVLKWDDIYNELSPHQRVLLASMIRTCNLKRTAPNKYLVLNMDDDISIFNLRDALEKVHQVEFERSRDLHQPFRPRKIRDIAVALVNAILKAKEEK